jgi:exodeoxyribonuclease VIII
MIRYDMSPGEYHAHPARSKSYLWKLYNETPAHAELGVVETTKSMDLGTGVHYATLEPHLFEEKILRGTDDRRGNKWKDVLEEAAAYGKLALTSGDYDKALRMGDSARKIPIIRRIAESQILAEPSAFWTDSTTALECRCRPDIYSPAFEIMVDLKAGHDASPRGWSKIAADKGYHAQEAWYTEGWTKAGGGAVDGFIFLAIEDEFPHLSAVYELTPRAVDEGRAAMAKALATYKQCKEIGVFPGYPETVQELELPSWTYRETLPSY